MKRLLNTLILVLLAGAVVLLVMMVLRPTPTKVDIVKAERGPMRVTVDGEGKTRVRDRYTVAAPVAGRLQRINLRRGDTVELGQVVAKIESLPLAPLDQRQREEAIARINAAEDARREIDQTVNRNKATYDQALRDLERSETLARSGVVAREEVERAQTAVSVSLRELEAARSKSQSAAHEVEIARAALLNGTTQRAPTLVAVKAPTAGKVLSLIEESERVVAAGAPLIELSNPSKLEVVIELLSTDGVKVQPGALVLIEDWGGEEVLQARVRLVEPSAFTKVSALGIEEQRVNVIADLTSVASGLGDGYRVEGRVVIWESDDVLQVPVSSLFRRGDSWSLFVVQNGEALMREVEVAHRTPFQAEITRGLEAGTAVIVHPSNQIRDGTAVEARSSQ